MAVLPWRFQADLKIDNTVTPTVVADTDPDVTVFLGETYTSDLSGERALRQDTTNPLVMKLSELPAFLTSSVSGVAKEDFPKRQGPGPAPAPAPVEAEVEDVAPRGGKRR